MNSPAVTVQRQQARQSRFIANVVTLPFRLFGVLCGSLLLSILIEWVGMQVFWPNEGPRHAEGMMRYELSQISSSFARSMLAREPGQSAERMVRQGYHWIFVRTGLRKRVQNMSAPAKAGSLRSTADLRDDLGQAYVHVEPYLITAAYTVLVFLIRLLVLYLILPLFVTAAFVGFVDGLVRRDLRRFGAGRESGFVYHRAKVAVTPLIVLPWTIYLVLPISVSPLLILLPSAVLLGAAVDVAAGSFKKYL